MAKRGRKARITEKIYLDTVRKGRTTDNKILSTMLGLDRSTVLRYKQNNPRVFEKGLEIVNGFKSVRFDPENITYEMFKIIPVIEEWEETQKVRRVGAIAIKGRIRTLYNVCRYLKVHPDNLNLNIVSKLVVDARRAFDNNLEWHRGLTYLTIRKPLRSFFQLVRGISGELLTSKGIDAGRSKGTGSHSSQKVTELQRENFILELPEVTKTILSKDKYNHLSYDDFLLEIEGISYWMYYTATRIGSTFPKSKGSLSIRMDNKKHVLSPNEWSINLMDKGRGLGIEWDKVLMDDALNKMRKYVCERFSIQPSNVDIELREIEGFLFPTLNDNYDIERQIMKLALSRAGNMTTIPNHIWRHTFAQDFLPASDWNYELCASIGGWKDTGTLKLHYGKMSEDAKRRGLRKVMGLPIEDVTYQLRW